MTQDIHVVLWARQAGTAHAFVPVIERLRKKRPMFSVEVLGTGIAADIFRSSDITMTEVSHFSEAEALIEAGQSPNQLLTGTSLNVDDDARYWTWAAQNQIQSTAFVDNWTNYWQRFSTSPDNRFDATPDRIAVIDTLARQRLADQGVPSQQLVVSGDPRFALLRQKTIPKDDVRQHLDLTQNELCFAFVSEPLSDVYSHAKQRFGYDEWDALDTVAQAISRFADKISRHVQLVLCPHPRESSEKYASFVENSREFNFTADISALSDHHNIVGAADTVFGMHSMLLYETTLLGVPAVSVRPERKTSNDLVDGHDCINCASSHGEIIEVMTAIQKKGSLQKRPQDVESIDTFIDTVFAS